MTANSQFAYAAALREVLERSRSWLDLGCGHQFLPSWMDATSSRVAPPHRTLVVGIDRDVGAIRAHPALHLRIVGDVERLPVAAASFDLVTANMVVEHLATPDAMFREVGRVLAPGGTFLVHTPNVVGYTTLLTRCLPPPWRPILARLLLRRDERDVYPTFYKSNSISALRRLAELGGLQTVGVRTVLSSPQLFRIVGVGRLEARFLEALAGERWARWRPCIIAQFSKSG